MASDWEIVNDLQDLPKEMWDYFKRERFFGLVIPKEYGGHGFSALAHSTIVTKIATHSLTMAVNMMVPNSLGPAELVICTTALQNKKNYYLPRLAEGKEIPCFALTGPEAGSDAGSITDSGMVCYGEYRRKKSIGHALNVGKSVISRQAPIATVLEFSFSFV